MRLPEENSLFIWLHVDQPERRAEVAVDEHGQIAVNGILNRHAEMVDVAVGDVTSTDFTYGRPPHWAFWAKSWATSLRPPKLGESLLCARAKRGHWLSARILRPFTVVDLIPPTAVPDLAVSDVTESTARVTWGEATDNYGLAGYDVSIDGGPPSRTTVGTRSYDLAGLAPSTSHTVSVVAIDLAGNTSPPATTSFTTAAEPPPPTGDLTFEVDEGAASAVWHPVLPAEATYRVSLEGSQLEEFPPDQYCQDADGNPVSPCTAQDVIRFPIQDLEGGTPYTFEVLALAADGTVARSLSDSFRTTIGPSQVPPASTELVASEASRCAVASGDFYVAPAARASVPLPEGATQLFDGCYTVPDSSCVDSFLPASEATPVDCEDDLTALLAAVSPPNRGPVISSLDDVVDYAAPVPGQRIQLEPVTWCTQGACTLLFAPPAQAVRVVGLAARALAIATAVVAAGGTIIIGVVVGLALGLLLAILFPSPINIGGLIEYPIHFDTDFDSYEDWYLDEGIFYNSLKLYAETIETTNQLARQHNIDFAWNSVDDQNLKRVITVACAAQQGNPLGNTTCGDGFAVYVPGALNYRFRPMPETGTHIVRAMGDGSFPNPPERGVWFYPARSINGRAATSAGFSRGWFDRLEFRPNNCTGRTPPRNVCDEFPFWATDQAVTLSGIFADLLPVPQPESSPQGSDISAFYRECKVDDTERFVVLPVKPWVDAGGPSFGMRVTSGGVNMCLVPQP